MKAIVYGQEKTCKKLAVFLTEEGVEMKKADINFYETTPPPSDEGYDLAIVDSRSENAEAACKYIRKAWHIPIVLVVNPRQANWKGLIPLDADGYIPEAKKGVELSARARALLRRLFLRAATPESGPIEEEKGQELNGEDYMCVVR